MSTIVYSGADLRLVSPLMSGVDTGVPEAGESPSGDPEMWRRLIEEVEGMRTLTEDWDGQGGEAPAAANLDWAAEWVRQMRQYQQAIPPSRAVPGVAGELYLEWQWDSFYLVAEIASPGRVEWTLSVPGQANRHWLTEGRLPYFLSPGR